MGAQVRRSIPLLIAAPALLWLTWGRSPVEETSRHDHVMAVERQPLPPPAQMRRYLGPFRLEGAWRIRSKDGRVFGYSALVPQPDGERLLAFNDAGQVLWFSPPDARRHRPPAAWTLGLDGQTWGKKGFDVESATRDPHSGRYWVGLEGANQIVRLSPGGTETARVSPPGMAGWGMNTGAEAMTRLADGRFVAIREVTPSWRESRLHDALLFAGDPVDHADAQRFQFEAPDNYSVVDMAMLPDGRALILLRRLLWPFPMRFTGRIVIADTARIRGGGTWRSMPLAALASVLPVDNFEAIAAVPRADGRITVWILSDDNRMRNLQRTLLWKLSVDPTRLPWPR